MFITFKTKKFKIFHSHGGNAYGESHPEGSCASYNYHRFNTQFIISKESIQVVRFNSNECMLLNV